MAARRIDGRPFLYLGGSMSWPSGRAFSPLEHTHVTSHFHGPRESSTGHHEGTDFAALTGTVVRAPRDGIIVLAIQPEVSTPAAGYWGYGGIVGMLCPGDMSLVDPRVPVCPFFAHLSRVLVGRGTIVRAGTPIALSGSESGRPPKFARMANNGMPHLHAELRRTRRYGELPFPSRYGELTEGIVPWLNTFGIFYRSDVRIVRGSTADPNTWR